MVCTVNASTSSSAIVSTADGSGILKIMSNGVTTNALAWVNFNGLATSGSATVRASYNVSSVTANATGDFTINFSSALTDANYVPVMSNVAVSATNVTQSTVVAGTTAGGATLKTTSQLRIACGSSNTGTLGGDLEVYVAVFGN